MGLVDWIDRRTWPDEYLAAAVGEHTTAYFCHATDDAVRGNAASGGAVSAVLIELLESGEIDGALVVTSSIVEQKVESRFEIARTRAEILAAQGSKYMPVYFRHAEALIRGFEGNLAAVLLPCDAKALARLRRDEPAINDKVAFVITLFCGHNSERALTDAVIERHRRKGDMLLDFRHRFGHWRGNLRVTFANRPPVVRKFAEFSDYQNLFFFAQRKCHACFDHTGFYCDLSAGDVWSQKFKHDPVKHSGVIIRSPRAQELLDRLLSQGKLERQQVTIRDICNGQSRSLPFHYNVSARSRVGGLFGMRLKDLTETKVKWNDVIVAFFVMLNERVTRSRTGQRIVLKIPRPLLKAYLILLKGLESI